MKKPFAFARQLTYYRSPALETKEMRMIERLLDTHTFPVCGQPTEPPNSLISGSPDSSERLIRMPDILQSHEKESSFASLLTDEFYAILPLSRGKVALVDVADLQRVLAVGKWSARWTGTAWYAVNGKGGRVTYLHRFILGLSERNTQGEHRNGDGLDCRRHNLRPATPSENGCNKAKRPGSVSRFKGVDQHHGLWRARIRKNGKQDCLGHFSTQEEAALAYNDAARDLHGDFARLNVVGPLGFEPSTFAVSRQRSNQMSYGPLGHHTAGPRPNAGTSEEQNV